MLPALFMLSLDGQSVVLKVMRVNKKSIIATLKQQGFTIDEADRIYAIFSELIKQALQTGQLIHLNNVLKLYPRLQKPRKRYDHFHKKTIFVGECVRYRLRIFCENEPPTTSAAVFLDAVM
jgi:Bacterial DNA-binding protein